MQARSIPKILSFESIMWLFMRISGLAMYVFALTGLAIALIMGARTQMDMGTLLRWTFFPIGTHVTSSDILVLEQWINPFWSIMQYLIIIFATMHGTNGLRTIVEDYMDAGWGVHVLRGLLLIIWLFMLLVAFNLIQTTGAV